MDYYHSMDNKPKLKIKHIIYYHASNHKTIHEEIRQDMSCYIKYNFQFNMESIVCNYSKTQLDLFYTLLHY